MFTRSNIATKTHDAGDPTASLPMQHAAYARGNLVRGGSIQITPQLPMPMMDSTDQKTWVYPVIFSAR